MKGGDILDFYKGGGGGFRKWGVDPEKRGGMTPPYQLRTTLRSIVSEENVSCSEIPFYRFRPTIIRLC